MESPALSLPLTMIAPLVTVLLGFTLHPSPIYRGVAAPRASEPLTLSADRIRRRDAVTSAVLGVAMVPAARSDAEEPSYPKVKITTTAGVMDFELWNDVAPKHVESFLKLTKQGFYDGGAFHRIIPGFVIQGGDPNAKVGYGPVRGMEDSDACVGGPSLLKTALTHFLESLSPSQTGTLDGADKGAVAKWGRGGPGYTVPAEFNSRKHELGVLSMARSNDPNSAGSQFFVCLGFLPSLDNKYTTFGKLISGEDVLLKIAAAKTVPGDIPFTRQGIERVDAI